MKENTFFYTNLFSIDNGTMEENEINLILQLYNTLNVKRYN